ncbi:hypothetical protein PFISCL1PPCAC_16588, partial [Pristionchus fissidentatus]
MKSLAIFTLFTILFTVIYCDETEADIISEPQVEALKEDDFPEPNGHEENHPCISGACPEGFTCKNEKCLVRRLKRGVTCPPSMVIGECLSGLCPNGSACGEDNMCCVHRIH